MTNRDSQGTGIRPAAPEFPAVNLPPGWLRADVARCSRQVTIDTIRDELRRIDAHLELASREVAIMRMDFERLVREMEDAG